MSPPQSTASPPDRPRLCADLLAYQRQAPEAGAETLAERHLRDRVAEALVQLAIDLAAARFGDGLAQLGVEPADVGAAAGERALRTLPRLRLTGEPRQDGPLLKTWVGRHVEWTVRSLARQHGRPQEWWWEATRAECWARHARLWEQYFLMLQPEAAAPAWRELRRRFFRLSYRDLLRATLPGAAPAVREVLRLVRADVRAWVGTVEVSLTPGEEGEPDFPAAEPRPDADPEARLLREELRRLVQLCLARLEEREPRRGRLDRRLLHLRYLEERRLGEIAAIVKQEGLGRLSSEAAVCRRLRRAEGRLRALLLEAGVVERAARPVGIVIPVEASPVPPSGLPLPRGAGKLPGADCLSLEDAAAARHGLLPPEAAAAWEAHAAGCRFCAARLRPGEGAALAWDAAAALPAAERRRLWNLVPCLPPDAPAPDSSAAGKLLIAWLEPPAVDTHQRLLLRGAVPPARAGESLRLQLGLTDGRRLALPEVEIGADGGFTLRVPSSLPPGARVDPAAIQP